MATRFVRGGTFHVKDRESGKGHIAVLFRWCVLFLVSLGLSGCFGERVSEQQHLDSPALAPGASSSKASPLTARILKRRPIVDRTGTILCISKENPGGEAVRVKPYPRLIDDIIGFTDRYGRGLDGVEYVYDGFLLSKGRQGDSQDPLVLAIDKNLQAQARQNLQWQMRRLRAKAGSLIVMEVKTGQIVAMASVDTTGEKESGRSAGLATSGLVNPWPVVAALAQAELIDGRVKALAGTAAESGRNGAVEPGRQDPNGKQEPVVKLRRWHWYSFMDRAGIWTRFDDEELEGLKLQGNTLSRLIELGFGQKTGIDLPEEQQGRLPTSLSDNVTSVMNSSASSTPLQLLCAYTAILRNGGPVRPKIAMNGSKSHGSASVEKRLFGPKAHDVILSTFGDDSGPSLAAYSPLPGSSSGRRYQVIGLGFYPVKNPEISYISVLFDARHTPVQRRGTLGKMAALARRGAAALKARYRFASNRMDGEYAVRPAASEIGGGKRIMPDLRGMSIRSALEVAGRLGMKVRVSGTGKVLEQYPRPGRRVSAGRECVIVCGKGPA